MSHPLVWADAKAKVIAMAANYSLPVELPNEGKPESNGLYLRVEIHSSGSMQMDLDNSVWLELGTVAIDLLVPNGHGFDQANSIRHEIGRVFRRGIPPQGLAYLETSALPGEQADELGNWFCLTLAVSWRFQDLT